MKKFLLATTSMVAFAAIGAASAADLPLKAPAMAPIVAPAYSWTGCYVGGHVGGGWRHTEYTTTFADFVGVLPDASASVTHESSSFLGGAQAGCNYQFQQHLVFGIEGDWTGARFGDTISTMPLGGGFNRDFHSSAKSLYDVALRLGYAQDNWLLYGKGGWAGTSMDFSMFRTFDQRPQLSASGVRANGFVAGVGGEYRLYRNVTLGLEYDFYGFTAPDQIGVNIPPATTLNLTDIKHSVQTVTLRLNFLFGWDSPVVARY
jgi:outer membrane immunogenic protein